MQFAYTETTRIEHDIKQRKRVDQSSLSYRNKEESAASTAEKGLSRTLGTLAGRATMI